MAHLHAEEIALYHREGWMVPRWRLSEDRVATMRAALDELLARNPGVRPEKLVSAHIERAATPGAQDNGEGARGVAVFLDRAREPEIVDLAADLIGDDVIPWDVQALSGRRRRRWPVRPWAGVASAWCSAGFWPCRISH